MACASTNAKGVRKNENNMARLVERRHHRGAGRYQLSANVFCVAKAISIVKIFLALIRLRAGGRGVSA